MDNTATVFLCILLASPLIFILGMFVIDRNPNLIRKFNKKFPAKSTSNPVINKKDKVNYGIVNEKKGKRGGRYETRYSKKTGKPYRHYF